MVLGVGALAGLAPILFFTGLYVLGVAVAPELPAPPSTPAPPLMKDALWARAEGGSATELRPINPVTMAQMVACVAAAPGDNDNQRIASCRHVMPGLPAIEYLSNLLLRDHGVNRNSFRGGAGAMVTTLRVSQSWTKQDFLNTLAALGDFGYGWRGIEAAAHGYFGRAAADLTLPQAALIASRLGDLRPDPWCDPGAAATMRNRVLTQMGDSGAISEIDFNTASVAELGLAPPPEGRPPCDK